ncbi:MAG: hypothetical protein WAU84_03010 [Thermoguttaceae bacterium]
MNLTLSMVGFIFLLLPVAWLVASIVLLAKPRTRVAGIAVLVAPLALVVIVGAFRMLSRPVAVDVATESEPAWQSHHAARTAIEFDDGHGHHRNVDVPPPSAEGDDSFVASEHVVVTPGSSVSYMKIAVLLFALLFFGGFVAAIVMLAFLTTRTAGIVLLAIGVPATLLLAGGVGWFFVDGSPQREFLPPPVHASMNHDGARSILGRNTVQPATRVPDAAIPVEAAEKVAVKSPKPAAKPPAVAAGAAGHAPVKATTADEKKPAAPKTAAAPPPPSAPVVKPPAWVNQPPQMLGDTYQMTIVVGPYATPQECNDELPAELQRALNRYVQGHVSQSAGVRPIALPYDFLREEVVKGQWEEIAPSSVGPMTRLYVLLQFDRKVRERIVEEGRRSVVAGRLWTTGVGLAGLLWLLAVMYGYLTIDVRTGGLYRRRLRFAAFLAILGPVAAALLAAV